MLSKPLHPLITATIGISAIGLTEDFALSRGYAIYVSGKCRELIEDGRQLKIYCFTLPELNYFREYCNFTLDELTLFNYRAKNYSLEQCAEFMNVSVSTVKRISRKVNNKILKVYRDDGERTADSCYFQK